MQKFHGDDRVQFQKHRQLCEPSQEHLVDGNEIGAANDLHLIGCAERELKNYEKAIDAFKEARALFKRNKEVIHVARCDQKMAS